jgi:hypothetical protein
MLFFYFHTGEIDHCQLIMARSPLSYLNSMNTLKFTLLVLDSFAIPLSCGYNFAIVISPACAFNQITRFTLFYCISTANEGMIHLFLFFPLSPSP